MATATVKEITACFLNFSLWPSLQKQKQKTKTKTAIDFTWSEQ